MGNRPSSYEHRFQQRQPRPTSTYSRHCGARMGSYSRRNGGALGCENSVFIGRQRFLEQIPESVVFPVSKVTSPHLGMILVAECGDEDRHPYLNEQGRTTLMFLKAAISFIPYALHAGADLGNVSLIFAQPGREFAIKAGNGDWEFYFAQDNDGEIFGHCVRKPMLRYIWDGVRKVVRYLFPIFGPPAMAALMAL